MQKSKIEWCNYTVNPIKGICQQGCDYCYAIRMYNRFKWNPEIRYDHNAFKGLENLKAGSKIFVCSTHDMFGGWVNMRWIQEIIATARLFPWLIFIYLTKNPQNTWIYSYPKNVWLGVTVESQEQIWRIKTLLQPEIKASLKFVSFEPLQSQINFNPVDYLTGEKIAWMIIGAETGNRKEKIVPLQGWITHLLEQQADTPAFLKNNLNYIGFDLHQEYPNQEED